MALMSVSDCCPCSSSSFGSSSSLHWSSLQIFFRLKGNCQHSDFFNSLQTGLIGFKSELWLLLSGCSQICPEHTPALSWLFAKDHWLVGRWTSAQFEGLSALNLVCYGVHVQLGSPPGHHDMKLRCCSWPSETISSTSGAQLHWPSASRERTRVLVWTLMTTGQSAFQNLALEPCATDVPGHREQFEDQSVYQFSMIVCGTLHFVSDHLTTTPKLMSSGHFTGFFFFF